jgi:hypothetical protein
MYLNLQNCGERRFEVVPKSFAQKSEKLLRKYGSSNAAPVHHMKGPGSHHTQPISRQIPSARRVENPVRSQTTASSAAETLSNQDPKYFPQSELGYGQQSNQIINMPPAREQVVFLGVGNGGDCSLAQISVSTMDDDAFFEALRENYNKLRGFMRRYLSYEVYHHCDFVQVS